MILSVLPNLLGFTIGGYALWLTVGDDKFREIICRPTVSLLSPFMRVNSSFVHLIVVQISAILLAIMLKFKPMESVPLATKIYIANNMPSSLKIASFSQSFAEYMSAALFIYSILALLTVTFAIFRVAYWYEDYIVKSTRKTK